MVLYSVGKIEDLINIIIPHFKNYSLITQKGADFILFEKIVKIMTKKEHLNIEGLSTIINIKSSMNLGLSDIIKSNFNNIIPIDRPVIIANNIPEPNWVSGFVTGEGNFDVRINQSKSIKKWYNVSLRFRIYQNERDIKLLELLIKYLGRIEQSKNTRVATLIITKISDINNIIIPFFEKNPELNY